MPDSNLQNFEIPQETTVPQSPMGKRNKLLYALIPAAIFLVIIAVAATLLAGNKPQRPSSVTATPLPTGPTPTPKLTIATTSAFFPFVASISAVNQSLDTVDLTESTLAIPQLDLHISFDQTKQ